MTLQASDRAGMEAVGLATAERRGESDGPAGWTWSGAGAIAVALLGGGVAVVAADVIARSYGPPVARDVVPLVAFAAGLLLAWRRTRPPPVRARDDEGAGRRSDRAVDEPAPLAIDHARSSETGSGPFDSTALSAVVAPDGAGHPDLDWATAQLGQYHLFTDILNSQLASVTDLTEDAAATILKHLADIDGRVTALVDFIKTSGSNEHAAQVVSLIEAQMKGCQDLLNSFAIHQNMGADESRKQRGKIADETRGVLDVLDGVDGIARHTTVLSFNVSIEAARAGELGRGFMVIGDEIRKLAAEVRTLAKDARKRIEALMKTVTVDLQQRADQRDQTEREAIGRIGETLGALTDNLMTLIRHQRDILCKVESENEAIARPLMQVMGSIQFQDIIRQQLEQLIQMSAMVDDHLQFVGDFLERPCGETDRTDLSDKVDHLYGSYVMDRQRTTHRAAQGQAVAQPAGALIELF